MSTDSFQFVFLGPSIQMDLQGKYVLSSGTNRLPFWSQLEAVSKVFNANLAQPLFKGLFQRTCYFSGRLPGAFPGFPFHIGSLPGGSVRSGFRRPWRRTSCRATKRSCWDFRCRPCATARRLRWPTGRLASSNIWWRPFWWRSPRCNVQMCWEFDGFGLGPSNWMGYVARSCWVHRKVWHVEI